MTRVYEVPRRNDGLFGMKCWDGLGFTLQHRISFNAAISSCEKSGRWQEALGVFWEAQLEGVQTNARRLVHLVILVVVYQ